MLDYSPRTIRTDLGEPEAIVITSSTGETVIMADHNATDCKIAVMELFATYIATADIPAPRGPHGMG